MSKDMAIGAVARETGVSVKTIRYCEDTGLIPPAEPAHNGYRVYGERAIHLLRFVKRARDLGFSVEDVGHLLALWSDRGRTSADVKAVAKRHLDDVAQRITQMDSIRRTLQHLVDCCHRDSRPDYPILEDLIGDRPARRSAPRRLVGLLHDAARQVSLLPDARSIADAAVDQAVRALGGDAAVLVLATGGSPGPMEVQASVGLHDPPALAVAPIDLHCIVQLGRAITVADLTGPSPRAAEVYRGVGFAPLEANGAIIGLLGVKQPATLEPPDLELLCGLAAVAAVALEQVRLREAAVASERKQAELERRFLQEKIESLSRVVAGVTHELNTPLGVIASSADVMARAAAVVKEQMAVTPTGAADAADRRLVRALFALDDNAATVQSSVERVKALVRSLQRFVRLDEAPVKMIDLHQGLEDTLALLGPDLGGNVEIRRAYGPPLQVLCTPAQVNIVFMALLRNAIQAVAGEGVITVRTWPDGGDAVVAIQDTGRGIEQHDLGAVFSPGFSRWDVGVGTGLGLTTTQAVMERHGGSVAIDSELGAGTTVTLRFPLDALTHNGGTKETVEMIKLKVTGMTCGHCEAAVRKALKEVVGVERVVEVSHQRNEALVEGTPRHGDLVAAVKGEGFEAE